MLAVLPKSLLVLKRWYNCNKKTLNFAHKFAISLLIRFSSDSRTQPKFIKKGDLFIKSIPDTGHVVNVRLYCPTTDKLLKLVLTYT